MFGAHNATVKPATGITYNSDLNWGSGSLPGVVTHAGGTNGTKWNSSGVLVSGSSGRITYDPTTLAALGLLVEDAIENRFTTSNDPGTGDWGWFGGSITADTTTSPDGTTNADTFVGDPVTADASVFYQHPNHAMPAVSSAFVKIAPTKPTNFVALGAVFDTAAWVTQIFNISSKTLGSAASGGAATQSAAGIQDVGNGWVRIWIEAIATDGSGPNGSSSDGAYVTHYLAKTATDSNNSNGDVIFTDATGFDAIWFCEQLEKSPDAGQLGFPTSPVYTDSSTATRAADSATTTDSTYLACRAYLIEARTALGIATGYTQTLAQWGTLADGWIVYRNSSNEIHLKVTVSSVDQCDLNLGTVANATDFKVAFRVGTNDFAGSLNGGTVQTNSSGTLPTITAAQFGYDSNTENFWYSTIKRIRGTTTLSNTQLVTVST